MPTRPDWSAERLLWKQGYLRVAGVDEVGRGPLAGPVVAAAVVFPRGFTSRRLPGLRDSKQLTAAARERLAPRVRALAVAVGVGSASPSEIDALGIVGATVAAMTRAVRELPAPADHLLVDALPLDCDGLPCRPIVHGDALCCSIAAASIVAKVVRDALMEDLDAQYPGYGLARHKGYPTAEHLAALERLGPTPLHRRSFAPVRRLLEAEVA
ncbi:MAG: ribonuclease HII [Chloroflexota bacterium]|nr:ribonuclease HII [Chloroflexota bacterium]